MKLYISTILILIVLVFGVAVNSQNQADKIFEYKFEYSISEKKANELGAKGWELASSHQEGNISTFVFKREKK
jgi:hypothetical protein